MNLGERLVYLTAWLTTACYFAALLASPASSRRRRFWTLGWCAFVLHLAAAFHFVHHWSHTEAAEATSRRALEVTGSPAPGGIYFNYVFLLVWTLDVAWLWIAPTNYARRPRPITWIVHGFLLFIFVIATVVFGHGLVRWLGAAALVILAIRGIGRTAGRLSDRRESS
jgi:hypothetical protein